MKGGFRIKKVDLHEIDLLADISLSTFTESFYHQNDPSDFEEYAEKSLKPEVLLKEWEDPRSEFYFLYNTENKLIGYFKLNIGINRFQQPVSDHMELQRIYISDKNKSQGAGGYLLSQILHYAKSLKMTTIWLGVWEHNPGAIRFYERNGFKRVGDHHFNLGQSRQLDYILERLV